MRARLSKRFSIEAAHHLPRVPAEHRCRNLHGHAYSIEIVVEGEVDEQTGWVMDYAEIQAACTPLLEQLDHRCLNDVPGLENPTSENLACWIWERLRDLLPLAEVRIDETCSAACIYRGE